MWECIIINIRIVVSNIISEDIFFDVIGDNDPSSSKIVRGH